jgi:hypothetical protein
MKALTLTQPWAALVVIGAKAIETRDWWTSFRGQILITASKKWPVDCKQLCLTPPFSTALGVNEGGLVPDLPLGYALGVVDLVECFKFDAETERKIRRRSELGTLPPFEADFGDYSAGRSGFVFKNERLLPDPVPCKGALGLWDVPADLEHAVLKQLKAMGVGEGSEAAADAMVAAFRAIDDTKADRGDVPCPICGGKLSFAISGPKRHVRAACETQGCLRFMS